MKFDRLEHSKKFVSNPGSRFKEEFHGVIQEDGTIDLVSDGYVDIQKEIEEESVGTTLPEIIARITAGDPSAFREEGFYADIVGMPKTYAEILNTVNDAKRKFEILPAEVREKFHNNFEEWFATFGSKQWLDGMELTEKHLDKPIDNVVKKGEEE